MAQPLPGTSASLEPLDSLYAAPRATTNDSSAGATGEVDPFAAARRESARLMRRRSLIALAVSVGMFALGIACLAMNISGAGALMFVCAALVAAVGFLLAVVALGKGVSGAAGGAAALSAVGLGLGHAAMGALGMFSALLSTMAFTRGRQIRVAGKILLPPVDDGRAEWTKPRGEDAVAALAPETRAVDEPTRTRLAEQWRENGRTEHASVAAFARLTLDLIALGAPPALVASSNADALDEIRHAEQCFALARALDGKVASPGAFPSAARVRSLSRIRTVALAELAVDSLVDGALHEGVSARIIAKLARRVSDPAIATMMKGIAADEGRHARHGWDVVRFCLDEGGESVARALEGALAALPKEMKSPMPEEARDGSWERWGLMGEALEAEEHDAMRADLERRVHALVASSRSSRRAAA